MAKLCYGLSLGIITVAGSMKGETTIHTWRSALAELKDCVAGGQDEMGEVDEVFKVLKYSFDWLKKRNAVSESNEFNRFQLCFLYCSLYPEDYKIVKKDLVRKFISEELLVQRRSWRAQVEQGHSVLDKLVNVCLLEHCADHHGIKCVKMHDLVRGMALNICKGKYMVRAGEKSLKEIPNQEEWTKDLEKVSLMQCGRYRIEEGFSPDCPKLSTLLLWGNNWLHVVPELFFSKMHGLCTLDLCKTNLRMLPKSVSDLTNLKALLLEGCEKLETVPYLGKLKAMRELNLSGTAIKEAPQGLEELLELRFLSMYARGLKMLPRGALLKLGHLQHLNLPLHIQIEEIQNLKQLEEFGGGMKNVNDFNWFITTHVHDPCYRIQVSSNIFDPLELEVQEVLGGKNNELVLCESNLKYEKVLGQGIAYLTIWKCDGMGKCFVDDLSKRFNNLTSLKKLMISYSGGIEWIPRSDGQISKPLEEIELWWLDDVKGVVMERGEIGPSTTAPTQPNAFSALVRLTIGECNKMRKVGLAVTGLPNLEYIYISSCGEIEEIFEENEGRATSVVTILTLPKLKWLRLK